MLLDNGNFILKSKFYNTVLLQTFEPEFTTGTWLPGAKVPAVNTITNESDDSFHYRIPFLAKGQFSAELGVEKDGMGYLILYYTILPDGHLYKYGRYLSTKELTNQYVNVSYVSNNYEGYFIYSVVPPYKFTRFVLNVIGELNLYV